MLMLEVRGAKKSLKFAYVIYEWSQSESNESMATNNTAAEGREKLLEAKIEDLSDRLRHSIYIRTVNFQCLLPIGSL